MENLWIFIITFFIPFVFFRGAYYLVPGAFKKNHFKETIGLYLHHLHFGLLFILIASFIVILNGINWWVIVLLGLGNGFAWDGGVSYMFAKANRKNEIIGYAKSTIWAFLVFVLISLILLFINIKFF